MSGYMTTRTLLRRKRTAPLLAPQRRAHVRAVVKVAVVSVIASELITLVLMEALIGEFLMEGMIIALICSAPISAWIADREIGMRQLIADQRDQLSALNIELNTRNADLDAFARAVAHDLKNPLSAIIGLAETLDDDPRVSAVDEIRDSVRSIVEAGDGAVEIIDGLLLLHGIRDQARELTPVDAGATVEAALKTLARTITEEEAIVTRSGAFPSVRAHGAWLVQVWVNLIGNAIKYGGSPPVIALTGRATPGGMVRFEVKDNGHGVAPDDQRRIFREYQRLGRDDVDGHGLGLAIVERVVNRLGGAIGVDNGTDGGSVFWFTVPAA